ncbi:MAG TPA: hypothetical protein PLU07_07130 [Ferruginibacter sp.]|nr:hypothetical protein [Ferruginibacter sp.]
MKLHVYIKLLNGGVDYYNANFVTIPEPMQMFELTHREKVFKLICTDISHDMTMIKTEEIQSFYEKHDVIHLNACSI